MVKSRYISILLHSYEWIEIDCSRIPTEVEFYGLYLPRSSWDTSIQKWLTFHKQIDLKVIEYLKEGVVQEKHKS